MLSGLGQFAGPAGPVEERSKVLILIYPLIDPGADQRIEEIRAADRLQFDQSSVLRVDTTQRARF